MVERIGGTMDVAGASSAGSGPAQIPVVITADRQAICAVSDLQVRLTPEHHGLLQALDAQAVSPVLATAPAAALSPAMVHALAARGANWAVVDPDGTAVDAMTGARLSSFADLTDRQNLLTQPSTFNDEPGRRSGLTFEVLVHHQVSAQLRIGRVLVELATTLGDTAPRAWGLVEPLDQPWTLEAVTVAAQSQMPLSQPFHVTGPGLWATVQLERDEHGVREHVIGGIDAGDWDGPGDVAGSDLQAARRVELASRTLVQLCADHRVRWGQVMRRDVEADGWRVARRHQPDEPLAVVIGSAMLSQMGVRAVDIADQLGGEVLGPKKVGSLLVRLDQSDPARNYAAVIEFLGVRTWLNARLS